MNKFFYIAAGITFLCPHVHRLYKACLFHGQPVEVDLVDRGMNRTTLEYMLQCLQQKRPDYEQFFYMVMNEEVYDDKEEFNSIFKLRELYNFSYSDKHWQWDAIHPNKKVAVVKHWQDISQNLVLAHLLARGHLITYARYMPKDFEWMMTVLCLVLLARNQFVAAAFAAIPFIANKH